MSLLRDLGRTLFAGFLVILTSFCVGAIVGTFFIGLCWVAPTGVCL